MKYAFTGQIVVDVHFRLLGSSITRQLRANYEYTPSWPYFDLESEKEVMSEAALKLDLEILVRPRAEKRPTTMPASREPYWTSANDLLAFGVLSRRVYERLNVMIDNDAHAEDWLRRGGASPGTPSLPSAL